MEPSRTANGLKPVARARSERTRLSEMRQQRGAGRVVRGPGDRPAVAMRKARNSRRAAGRLGPRADGRAVFREGGDGGPRLRKWDTSGVQRRSGWQDGDSRVEELGSKKLDARRGERTQSGAGEADEAGRKRGEAGKGPGLGPDGRGRGGTSNANRGRPAVGAGGRAGAREGRSVGKERRARGIGEDRWLGSEQCHNSTASSVQRL